MRVDAHASAVYGHMMVPPAQGGQVLRGVVTALGYGNDVMHFEAIGRVAAVDGTPVIAGEDSPAKGRSYRTGRPVVDDALPRDGDDFGAA